MGKGRSVCGRGQRPFSNHMRELFRKGSAVLSKAVSSVPVTGLDPSLRDVDMCQWKGMHVISTSSFGQVLAPKTGAWEHDDGTGWIKGECRRGHTMTAQPSRAQSRTRDGSTARDA